MEYLLDRRLIVKQGNITEMKIDAVVNAANSSLMGGGGVDGAIHKKGGQAILDECKEIRQHRYPDGLPTGKAVITSGGNLPVSHVIHTVGPVWQGGDEHEHELLKQAYTNSLKLASETGINTIAFPAISTGVYGFPREIAAPIVYKSIKNHFKNSSLPREIYLVFFSSKDYTTFLESIKPLL
jgi:O-acetyl-ADP-ribose deacetylase